jgi:hypothetical protein
MASISIAVLLITTFLSGLYEITYQFSLKLLDVQQETHPRSFYVHTDTQRQLFDLVRGDWPTALTIVDLVRQEHPDQDEQWIWTKAIWHLERIRR